MLSLRLCPDKPGCTTAVNRRSRCIVSALALVALLAAGCAGKPAGTGANDSGSRGAEVALTIAAAASLAGPFKSIGEAFITATGSAAELKFVFDSSASLASQIQGGAPGDVFASADEASMDRLASEGLLDGPPRIFARNRLAIVVKKGNPRGVKGLSDLPSVGIVALGGPEVPVGKYADQALASAGVVIPAAKITRAKDSRAVLTAVTEGDADAGIVFATDATDTRVDAISIPDPHNPAATYLIAVLKEARNSDAARAFLDFVLSPDGQVTLRSHGFMVP